jgi:hypothetical protein
MFPSASSSTSTGTSTANMGRLLYATHIPGPDRRLVRKTTRRALVWTLVSMALAALLVYFFHSVAAALAVPVPAGILANVRDVRARRLSIALLLVIYGAAFLMVGAMFPILIAPQLGLDPAGYPGLALLFFLVAGVPGALMALIGGAMLLGQYLRSSLHLVLYDRGLTLERLRSRRTYTWDEIASASREQRGRQDIYVIRPKRGRAFVLTEQFRDGRHIGEVLLRVFANSKLPG